MPKPRVGEQEEFRIARFLPGSSASQVFWPPLRRLLGMQVFYLAIAVVIYGIFWAVRPEGRNLVITVVYTLCLCNLTMLALESLSSVYSQRSPLQYWSIFLGLLLLLTPVMVTITTAIVFWTVLRPSGSFWNHLGSSWKFPSIATITFGIACQIYIATKCRLERRNRELQRTVESDWVELELQEEELRRAREIQQALLPKEIPQIEGFDIAGRWEPAGLVGGDYFDVIRLGETKLGICIADVVGKSVSAALLMANVQATVRVFALESASPAWLCGMVNSVLCANLASEKFVSLFYGVLDGERKTLRYTSAGHPGPILKRATGSVQQLENGGAVLGIFPNWKYEDSLIELSPGDRLVLFTDGITEAAKPDGEQLGEEGLLRLVETLAGERPTKLNAKLLADVKSFCDSPLQDDATLIAIAVDTPNERKNEKNECPSLLSSSPRRGSHDPKDSRY